MEIPPVIKKYWPYLLGGAVGLYLIAGRGGGSSSSTPVVMNMGPSDAVVQANAQLAAAQMQLDATNAANNKMFQLETMKIESQNALVNSQSAGLMAQLAAQKELGLAEIAAQLQVSESANYANLVASQGIVAQGVAQSAATTLQAMNAPAVAAITGASLENAAAMESAGYIAGMGFATQGDIFSTSMSNLGEFFKVPQIIGSQSGQIATAAADRDKRPGLLQQAVQTAGQVFSGYGDYRGR